MAANPNEPLNALPDAGEVLIDGPGTVIASLTPDAAEVTGQRLIAAAADARRSNTGSRPSPAYTAADAAVSVQNP